MPATKTTTKRPSGGRTKSDNVFTDEERAAVQATARERKSQGRRLSPEDERKAGEKELRDKVAEMPTPDREMGERIHALVTKTAPGLVPKTYYGMPAWAKDGKVICFFKPASKFKVRYASFEFQPDASLDDGEMWPVSFAVIKLTAGVEARIAELVKKAAG